MLLSAKFHLLSVSVNKLLQRTELEVFFKLFVHLSSISDVFLVHFFFKLLPVASLK